MSSAEVMLYLSKVERVRCPLIFIATVYSVPARGRRPAALVHRAGLTRGRIRKESDPGAMFCPVSGSRSDRGYGWKRILLATQATDGSHAQRLRQLSA
jgi:hypothetical protein